MNEIQKVIKMFMSEMMLWLLLLNILEAVNRLNSSVLQDKGVL